MFKQNHFKVHFEGVFFRAKVDTPLSFADVKFIFNHRREAKFVITSFL